MGNANGLIDVKRDFGRRFCFRENTGAHSVSYFKDDVQPKVLVTTSQSPSPELVATVREMLRVLPLSEYRKRRNFIHASFEEMGIPCIYPDGAFYAFADISKFGMTSKEFALKLLDEQNVACVPGTAFGASGEGFIRCSYATSLNSIKEAMVRIERFIKKL